MAHSLSTYPIFTSQSLSGTYVTQSSAAYLSSKKVQTLAIDVIPSGGTTTLKVEFANPVTGDPVEADFVQEAVESISGGTATSNVLEHANISSARQLLIECRSKFYRISVKGSGTVTVKVTTASEESFN